MLPEVAFRAGAQALRQRLANLERHPCYRSAPAPTPSSPGIGTYPDPATSQGDAAAASAAIRHRINAIDPSWNDRRQRSKITGGEAIGARVERTATARDERVVVKAHCPHPALLRDPRQRPLVDVRVQRAEIFLLHSPATRRLWLDAAPGYRRIADALGAWEQMVAAGRQLSRRKDLARRAGGGRRGFRFLPLPRHLAMAAVSARPRPGEGPLVRVAQRAIPFARSTPGVTKAGSGLRETGRLAETTATGPVQPWSEAGHASLLGGG
ncbi:MAG: hypothetical protein K7J47_21265 [Acidobacteria bacterium]|jgi:hypothetical protein|nr:hypothetical protein [Bryobacteraceae bacterium CoA2 C42]